MSWIIVILISFLSGIAAAMGLGGGMFLIVYLTLFANVAQQSAQGINLVFFIPAAAAALYFHTRSKLVEWKKVLPAAIAGAVIAAVCSYIANTLDASIIKRLFGAFILLAGMKTLAKRTNDER